MNIEQINAVLFELAKIPERYTLTDIYTIRTRNMENTGDDSIFKVGLGLYAIKSKLEHFKTSYLNMYQSYPNEEEQYPVYNGNMPLILTKNHLLGELYKLDAFLDTPIRNFSSLLKNTRDLILLPVENVLDIEIQDLVDTSGNKLHIKIGYIKEGTQTLYLHAKAYNDFAYVNTMDIRRIYFDYPAYQWIPYLKNGLFDNFPFDISEKTYLNWSDSDKKAFLSHYAELNGSVLTSHKMNLILSLQLGLKDSIGVVKDIGSEIENNAPEIEF